MLGSAQERQVRVRFQGLREHAKCPQGGVRERLDEYIGRPGAGQQHGAALLRPQVDERNHVYEDPRHTRALVPDAAAYPRLLLVHRGGGDAICAGLDARRLFADARGGGPHHAREWARRSFFEGVSRASFSRPRGSQRALLCAHRTPRQAARRGRVGFALDLGE